MTPVATKKSKSAKRNGTTLPTAKWTVITPKKAYELLENENPDNRRSSQPVVSKYAADMKAGRWRETGDAIRVAEDGTLLDGHHRLRAVIKAGVNITTLLVEGVAKSSLDAMDIGKGRSLGDHIKLSGGSYGTRCAAIVRAAMSYKKGHAFGSGGRFSNIEQLNFYKRNRTKIDEAASIVGGCEAQLVSVPSGPIGLVYLYTKQDRSLVKEFFHKVASGQELKKDTPEYALHRWLRSERESRFHAPQTLKFAVIVKAWNASVEGRSVKYLNFTDAEKFPTVL